MGVDIVDVVSLYASFIHGTGHGAVATVLTGLRDMAFSIGREAIATNLGQNSGTTGYGMVVVLKHLSRRTTAGHKAIAVFV